ncbi:MAG: bifunctional demethylmenaquinone methyltransferase/2-methoxy-6-polyprenyl-1,4-benzoquinol methylase UbiE [Gammaproteobacteria bacterium]|nr:bifunctional demethylmenaquinone methyltransferase/2-methoxy-6-polyprenyl-1,4-benzoquinol methylase UbiE [Gammaproteobacteria bacterium]
MRRTHFGFRQVAEADKADLVGRVFDSVANKYDLMNDLMSLGIHRAWKRYAIMRSGVRAGQRVLDVAAGSGDLAVRFARRLGPTGHLVVTDVNPAMLDRGRARLIDAGYVDNVSFVRADAERLPFNDGYFDCLSISFGLRNVTRQERALSSMFRCLRPGGRLLVLEFSTPSSQALARVYDAYSFSVLPRLGGWVTGDADSYHYLVESIRRQPPQQELKEMMQQTGFERVDYHNLSGGIVALHVGYKL